MIGKDTPKLMPSFAVKIRIQEVFSAVVELMGKKHAVTTFGVDWNSPPLYPSVVIWGLSNSISSPNISRTIWKCHVMWHGGLLMKVNFASSISISHAGIFYKPSPVSPAAKEKHKGTRISSRSKP